MFASPSRDHFWDVLIPSRFLNPVSKARDFDKNEDGATSDDIALVSPTDQQLRFCLCGLAAARRENIFGSWQIFQLTLDSSSGIGRHPTEILEESCTTSPTCSTSPEGSRGITILEKRSGRSNYIGTLHTKPGC